MFECQQALIKDDREVLNIIEYLCTQSNNIYNCGLYYARQVYFKTKKVVTGNDLCSVLVKNRHYRSMLASSSQQTCHAVGEAFKSFKDLNQKFKTGKIENKPNVPKYRKSGGLFTVSFLKKQIKLTDKGIRIPLGKTVKAWFGLKEFHIPMPSNLKFEELREIRFLPRNGCFYAEFVYVAKEVKPSGLDYSKALGIDHGVNNWLTCVDNLGQSFIINGKKLKSKNQWYNKRVSQLKTNKSKGFWSKQLANITEKRNRQTRDAINKVAKLVINHCIKNCIGKVVFGWNKGQKDGSKMGRKSNQEFVSIPTGKLKNRIEQLCEKYNIEFIETEESYTSKSSFLDEDLLPTYGEKPQEYNPSGKRIKRGLYATAQKWLINADCNGAANILKKVAVRLRLDLSQISRGGLTTPLKVQFWTV
ncbi:MAG: RNA-guided endonuclease InsQ/TnpB family protein [Waterburya sp.]